MQETKGTIIVYLTGNNETESTIILEPVKAREIRVRWTTC
jgi:hypothetical protein